MSTKVPLNYIKRLVKDYAASETGRSDIKEQTGVTYDPRFTANTARRYIEILRQNLYFGIRERITSFKPSDIICSDITAGEAGLFHGEIRLNREALRRESLYPEEYPEGVNDIVLHFVHGWHAKDYAYGVWSDRGSSVRSRKDKDPDPFLETIVNDFNSTMGDIVVAHIDDKYRL